MATGEEMLALALQHEGEEYVNVLVPKNNPNWHGPWDCAEFASWLVYQITSRLYGCIDDAVDPAVADAYTGAWKTDSSRLGMRIPVAQAAATVGGLVLRFPPQPGEMGHIAVCDGEGGTIEAMGHAFGVARGHIQGRRWDTGVLIPWMTYSNPAQLLTVQPPANIYYSGAPNMNRKIVLDIQQALGAAGFDPGQLDGLYGLKTAAAVGAFQRSKGLIMDGEVGPQTAAVLGVGL